MYKNFNENWTEWGVPVGSCVCVNITYPTWIILLMQVWNAGFVHSEAENHTPIHLDPVKLINNKSSTFTAFSFQLSHQVNEKLNFKNNPIKSM